MLSTDGVVACPRGTLRGQTSAMDESWYDEIAERVRQQARLDDEGGTWVLFLDEERRPMNGMALPHEELGPLDYDGLASVVDDVDAPAVVVAVPRFNGEPRAEDWRLWEELRKRMVVARSELIDLVVVGEQSWWAAVGGS
jgi:hypothetical protein